MIYETKNGEFNGLFNDIYQRLGEEGLNKSFYVTGTKKYESGERGDPFIVILPSNIGNENKNNWHSISQPNAYFLIRMKTFRFLLTDYTIRVRNDHDRIYPQEYRFECLDNNKNWNLLHYFNSTELLYKGATKTFSIDESKRRVCSIFKFTQIRAGVSSGLHFVLNCIEF